MTTNVFADELYFNGNFGEERTLFLEKDYVRDEMNLFSRSLPGIRGRSLPSKTIAHTRSKAAFGVSEKFMKGSQRSRTLK